MHCVATDCFTQIFLFLSKLTRLGFISPLYFPTLFPQFLKIQLKLGANAHFGIKVDFKNKIDEIILHNAENMCIFALESTN